MNGKIFAILAALMMVTVTGVAIIGDSNESEATLGANCDCGTNCNCDVMSMNFYIQAESGYTLPANVNPISGEGSNAYLALVDAVSAYNTANSTAYSVTGINNPTIYDSTYLYYMMNEDYGNVSSLFGLTNNSNTSCDWEAYAWNGSGWTLCTMGLGYYKSINDIPTGYSTHNIALVYTSSATAPTGTPSNNTVSTVSGCVEYDVSYYLTGSGVTSGWISGSGSDCYTAFVSAITAANLTSNSDSFNSTYDNQYYGYIDTFLGLAESYDEENDVWYSWSLFVWDGTQWVSAWFTMGHYTPGSDTYVDSTNSAFSMQTQYVMLSYGAWTSTPPVASTPFPTHSC